MRRGCCISVIVLFLLCIIGALLIYFVAIPRIRDAAQDGLQDAIATTVAEQIPAPPGGTASPGTYTLSESELQAQINENVDVQNVDDLLIDIQPDQLRFAITAEGDQDLSYTGTPTVVDGQLQMANMEASDSFLDWFFPADDLGEAIEDAVNEYLAQNNLVMSDLELTETELILITESAS